MSRALFVLRSATAKHPHGMCMNRDYDKKEVCELREEFGLTAHIRPREEETQDLKRKTGTKTRRRVVESTHSRLKHSDDILVR